MKALFALLLVWHTVSVWSQVRHITFGNWIRQMQEASAEAYRLSGVEIEPDSLYREWFRVIREQNSPGRQKGGAIEKIRIYRSVALSDIRFPEGRVILSGLVFEKEFIFSDFVADNLSFEGCEFYGKTVFSGYQRIGVLDCLFLKEVFFTGGMSRTEITQCRFGRSDQSAFHQVSFNGYSQEHSVIISSSVFFSSYWRLNFFLRFSEITLRNCQFECKVFFSYIYLRDKFALRECRFQQDVVFNSVKLPVENAAVTWPDLQHKIAVVSDTISRGDSRRQVYKAFQDEDLGQAVLYDELIATYSKFLQIFKFRNNSDWYNACYVEMKDIMTRKAHYDYKRDPILKNYLDWKIKGFLRDFSDYGTDYTKSILYALKVIFWFAIVFFFFPSQEESQLKGKWYWLSDKAIAYFKQERTLKEWYETETTSARLPIRHLKQSLQQARSSLPAVLFFLLRPVYQLEDFLHQLLLQVWQQADLTKGRPWELLSPKEKRWLNVKLGLILASYLAWELFLRALNAFSLSLNSLTTLGYGGFTAQGIVRYLVVLEGLIGWFLLTIFGVSLIGQVL
jgi:hypothetical protein